MLHVQGFERAYYLEHQDGCQRSLFFCTFIRQVSGLSMIFHQVSLLPCPFSGLCLLAEKVSSGLPHLPLAVVSCLCVDHNTSTAVAVAWSVP